MSAERFMIGQVDTAAEPAPSGVVISYEWVIIASASAILSVTVAAGRWLIGREFARFEAREKEQEQRLKKLEANISNQLLESQVVAKLDERVALLERQVKTIELALEALPRIENQVGGLEELKTLGSRFDNVVFALNQAQDLVKEFQRDVIALRAELPKTYVSEDKYVRDLSVLTSRVDAVWGRIDEVMGSGRMRYLDGGIE